MPRTARPYLDRFPLISTRELSAAREATSRFWSRHTSEVLGSEEYFLAMNRVLLGRLAVSYVFCTTRIRVVPSGASGDATLYVPLEGAVAIVADGRQLAASPSRPLLRGPCRTSRFEASPIRCLVVDLPDTALAAVAAAANLPPPSHVSIAGRHAERIIRLVKQLATAANRSRAVAALQRLSSRDRLAGMPESIRRLEHAIVEALMRAAAPGELQPQRGGSEVRCDVETLKAWLVSQAHRPVRIAELARRAGVTPRTVERAFLRTGCTPLDYLRGVRLDRARRILVDPDPAMTVAAAAMAAGFTHLGRFATEYRRHFGELPSQTLARGRRRRP
jgi:AraC-like DNA-binding protein